MKSFCVTEKGLDKIVAVTRREKRTLQGSDRIGVRVGEVDTLCHFRPKTLMRHSPHLPSASRTFGLPTPQREAYPRFSQ